MTVQQSIETKIATTLSPSHLEVVNESHMHSVPPGSESISRRCAARTNRSPRR
jgi:BolA protein